jgi:hypothetical protein
VEARGGLVVAIYRGVIPIVDAGPEEFLEGFTRRTQVPSGSKLLRPTPRQIVVRRKKLGTFFVGLFFSVVAPPVGWVFGYWLVQKNSQWQFGIAAAPTAQGCLLEFVVRTPQPQSELEQLMRRDNPIEELWQGLHLVTGSPPNVRA